MRPMFGSNEDGGIMRDTEQAEIMAPAAIAPGLRAVETPLVRATPESLAGYGHLVIDPDHHPIEIVRWPAKGWRQVDNGTGDEGGTTEGIFSFWWKGEVLYGRNYAVGNAYLLGWSQDPAQASEARVDADHSRVLLWHANYHPDGGQLFFPLDATPFVVPLALPGDDLKPEQFVSFYFDGSCGLSKLLNEKTARAFAMRYGADIYALRIGNVIEPHEYGRFPGFVAEPLSRKRNAWSYIDARDLAQIVHLCLQKDGLGFQVFNAVNDTITADLPTAEFLARYCPKTPIRRRLTGDEAPLSNRRAREVLGFREKHNWRQEVAALKTPRPRVG
jgi:hypothetical protein